ncbi:hypothetical protein ABDU67_08345 [Klebsiella pneumoniae]
MVKKSLRQFTLMATATVTLLLGIKYHCSKDEINDLSKMIERWL